MHGSLSKASAPAAFIAPSAVFATGKRLPTSLLQLHPSACHIMADSGTLQFLHEQVRGGLPCSALTRHCSAPSLHILPIVAATLKLCGAASAK